MSLMLLVTWKFLFHCSYFFPYLQFNYFALLNRNPLYLMVFFIIFLLSKALWVQMDLTGEFHNGNVSRK